MNSTEGSYYEVPIINLDDAEISNIKSPISLHETEDLDEDCTIIESENLKETKKPKNLYCNESISLLEDEKDDDCTIIENETDLLKKQSQGVTSSKSCQVISNPSSEARKPTTSTTKQNDHITPLPVDNNVKTNNTSITDNNEQLLEKNKEFAQTTVVMENVIGVPIDLDDDSERENNSYIVTETEELLKEKQSVQTGNVPVVLEKVERNFFFKKSCSAKNNEVLKENKELSQTIVTKEKNHDAAIILDDDEIENDEVLKENKDISQTSITTESSHATLDNDEKENDSPIAKNNEVLKENNQLLPAVTKVNIQTSITNEYISDAPIVLDDDTEGDSNSSKYDHEAFLKENKALAQLVEKCLDMENSTGMERIINRTVIPLYRDTSESFRKSPRFERVLTKTIRMLEMEPNRKFSCLKEFCETMKYYNVWNNQREVNENEKEKKRVQLTTLKRKLDGRFSTYKTRSSSSNTPNKKAKPDVIDLDDDDSRDETPQNNDSDDQTNKNVNNTVETNKPNNVNEHKNDKTNDHETDDDVIIIDENENHGPKETIAATSKNTSQSKSINSVGGYIDIYNNAEINTINDTLKKANDVKNKIEILEMKIGSYKKIIEKLELEEVDMNSENNSAYVQCETFKATVVRLYKEICRLTGTVAVKQHKVRLKVVEGRHEGPMRCLEEFINDNIDQDGNPPFPDMLDVIRCVSKANDLYQLGWTKRQIEIEAQSLFVHYGRTVQKRRQKREWRDLQRYFKEEVLDPADEDPMLQARLQENAKLAEKNEKDLLDRYAQMESKNTIQRIDIDFSETEDSNDGENSSELNNAVTYNNVGGTETVTGNITTNNNSSCSQIANNEVFSNSTNIAIQNLMLPLTLAQNPIKYLVIDENMRPIGITTKRQNSEPLGYIMQHINVANTPTNLLRNNELINVTHTSVNNINKTNANTNISEACKSINKHIRPNIGYFEVTDSLQHNEVTTNSEVDNNNIPANKDGKENEVSSSSEIFPLSYDPANVIEVKIEFDNDTMEMDCLDTEDNKFKAENDIESIENNDTNCGLDNVLKSSKTGVETVNDTTFLNSDAISKPVNDSGLMDKEDRSSTLVNGTQSVGSEITSCELVNGSKATENVGKPCELENVPKAIENDGKYNELVNNLHSVENQPEPGEVASDSQIIHASKSSEVTNTQSIENKDKSGEDVNDLKSIQSATKSSEHVNDETSNKDEVVVKKEKLDIQEMLKALGDDFTVTILSIDDPFEIIEISDSSDSEDDL